VKQQLRPAGHDKHDAMLIARLYGGDVSERERETALALVSDCGDCAQLFADLSAISNATRLLPTPPRPRDFALTEADAARLGRPAGTRRFGWSGLRRSLGGALAALGLVGVLLSGTSSLINPTAHPNTQRFAYDAAAATAAPANAAGQPQDGAVTAGGATMPPRVATAPGSTSSVGAVAAGATQPPRLPQPTPAGSAIKAAIGVPTASGTNSGEQLGPVTVPATSGPELSHGGGSTQTATSSSGSGTDTRPLAFFGFGVALLLGLGLLLGPRFGRFALRAVRR
jgi:hypothetical protein